MNIVKKIVKLLFSEVGRQNEGEAVYVSIMENFETVFVVCILVKISSIITEIQSIGSGFHHLVQDKRYVRNVIFSLSFFLQCRSCQHTNCHVFG